MRTPQDYELFLKHNRIPTPEMSFSRPNLPFLIGEIEALLKAS